MGIGDLLLTLLTLYSFVLFGRAIMSWFDPTFSSQIGRVVYDITEPLISPIRQVVPPIAGLDLSIMVAIFLVYILRMLIASALAG
ncbi:MAG TPA: YggT family protein [Thermomicrobiales bacterium]|nr:YggT family protein [Thermomicrobiales bacterium]